MVANTHLSPSPFSSGILRSCLALQCSHPASLILSWTTPCELWLDACVHTPANNLPILAGIQPAELRRNGATLPLARRAVEPGQLLHSALTCSPGGNARHLKSTHPFVPVAQERISSSDDNNRCATLWTDHRCSAEWLECTTRLRTFIPDIGIHPPGMALSKTASVRLNRLRTGIGYFRSCWHNWSR